ncbi:MAG: RadC family protein [Clostridia bacterium]|nr:RadC family protein [Clostridia bacterium]
MHEGHRERLTTKLLEGSTLLSDHEILEILLFYSIPRKNTNELAHRLLDNFGSLKNCFYADPYALQAIEGVGHKTASFIVTLGEIFRRVEDDKHPFPTIFSYDSCKQNLIDSFKHFNEEKFVAFFLNKSGEIILRKIFSSHSNNMVNIDMSELITGVLAKRPNSVVICHNHLSGNAHPSLSDDKATEKIYTALRLNNIALDDHIIVAGDKTYSYKASDKLKSIVEKITILLY